MIFVVMMVMRVVVLQVTVVVFIMMILVVVMVVVVMTGVSSADGGGNDGDIGGDDGDWDLKALPPPSPGLVREQEAGLLQFLRLDGFSVLMRAMQQQVQKLKVKSAFLLQNLLVGHPEHKGGAARAVS